MNKEETVLVFIFASDRVCTNQRTGWNAQTSNYITVPCVMLEHASLHTVVRPPLSVDLNVNNTQQTLALFCVVRRSDFVVLSCGKAGRKVIRQVAR